MPLIPVPPNPTWAQIETGIDAAGQERATAKGLVQAEEAKARQAKKAAEQASKTIREADLNYRQWIDAIARRFT